MEILFWFVAQIIWVVWTVLSWLFLQVFWLVLWLMLPICAAAVLCVFAAERLLGKDLVRGWLRRNALSFASEAGQRARKMLFALWSVPARVLGWFVVFALWYAVLNLWRTPRWTPWRRAWRCRWGYA